jgi:Mrp family chromosome partitioning ATPase/capsular polysaccharide biosynthesis protein
MQEQRGGKSAAARHLPRIMLVNDGSETYRPKPATARAAAAAARPATRRKTGIRGLASILRRRLPLFFATFALLVCLGAALAALQVPLYRASSEVVPSSAAAGAPDAAVRLIGSRALAEQVAVALKLDRDTAFLRSRAGGSLVDRIRDLAGMNPPAPPPGSAAALAWATDRLARSVSVTRPVDTVSLLIAVTARSPQLAARAANEYARQYARRQLADPTAPGAGARILAEAEPPLSPRTLSPVVILLAAAASGLVLGLIAAIIRERSFRGITSGGEIEARTGLHHLGTVPLVATVLKDTRSPVDAIVTAPRSGFAEAFRSLRTSIRIAGGDQVQVIAITSTQVGDGKSTVAACLARTVAIAGESVLLIDCSPTGRGAAALLGIDPGAGIGEGSAGAATLVDALQRDEVSGASVLSIGSATPDRQRMAALVDELRQRFSYVVIDAPTVLRGDASAVAEIPADLFVIAAKWRATPDRAVRQAAAALSAAGTKVGGVTLTQVDMHRQVKYVHDDESNYYAKLSKYYS